MIEKLFASANYDACKRLMDVSVLRHEAISSNLGNMETPAYKRVEVPRTFQAAFNEALKAGKPGTVSIPTLEQDKVSPSQRKDGNNVVLQDELMAMNRNGAEYEALTEFVSGTIRTLKMAIVGHAQ